MVDKSEHDKINNVISKFDMMRMTTEVVSAYVGNNSLPLAKIPDVINSVFGTLQTLDNSDRMSNNRPKPAVPIRKSVTPDFIVCLEDGKKTEDAQTASPHQLQHDAGRIPGKMGTQLRLPNGRSQLFRSTFQFRKAHRPGTRPF